MTRLTLQAIGNGNSALPKTPTRAVELSPAGRMQGTEGYDGKSQTETSLTERVAERTRECSIAGSLMSNHAADN
jgi:hypothetical protein